MTRSSKGSSRRTFRKVLIANRGEIALRILRACRECGLETVALYSEADREALHVRYADEACFLGPPAARDSYLRGDKILDIARRCGADAIHPGYGFLAEREDFAHDVEQAGLVFIGPPARAIAAMGNKTVARATMTAAGVRVVPGSEGEGDLRDKELLSLAPQIGFPLLIKATAGGGGKGMRVVDSMEEMPGLLQAARREAEASFGDGNVYLEKLIHNARHIEFQVLADSFGNVIHLGERECSLQRRHQKLLEESPSPFLDPQMRQRMGQVACRAAQAVDYVNAGTIEFLVDKEHEFYFLEMNTRLQVEHPVTEVATGVDIVREQIHIAQGGALRFKQEDVAFRQWALECRINAEDPFNHFLPSTGRITQIALPAGPGVRIDTGVYRGMEVSPYYDSLIAKLICWGETRQDAILRMRQALDEYHILGITTNIPFHQRIMQARRFVNGDFDTRFVEERFSMQEREGQMDELREVAAIMATLVAHRQSQRATRLVRQPGGHVSKWKWAGRGEQSKA